MLATNVAGGPSSVTRDPNALFIKVKDRVVRLEEIVAEHPPVEPFAEVACQYNTLTQISTLPLVPAEQ